VLNGRFKGGWTTRNYGRPADGIHAIQMELAQATHLALEARPFDYDPGKAEKLRPYLRAVLETLRTSAFSL
jgi:formiminoglutamase